MKILFISTMIPFPPKGGHPQRTYNLLKFTTQHHDVHLIGFIKKHNDAQNVRELENICKKVYAFRTADDWSNLHLYTHLILNLFSPYPYTALKYYAAQPRRLVTNLLHEHAIDLLHCDMADLALYRNQAPHTKHVLVFHNIESQLYRRRAQHETSLIKKLYFLLQSRKLKAFETTMAPTFDVAITTSHRDKAELLSRCPTAHVEVIPNGVDTQYFTPTHHSHNRNQIIFVGGLGWFPNEDGVLYFCRHIWPKIRRRRTNTTFLIVGNPECRSTQLRRLLANGTADGIKVLGFLSDLRQVVAQAGAFVVPLRIGGGTRLKILDAMAMGKAIVSTSVGCEGIDVTPGENILIADHADEFSQHVVRLLDDQDLCDRLGTSARKLVEDKYSWEVIGLEMIRVYSELSPGPRG